MTSVPPKASDASPWPVNLPLTPSMTTSTPLPSVMLRTPSVRLSLERSMTCSYPSARARSAFCVLPAVEITNEAPRRRATCTVSMPTALSNRRLFDLWHIQIILGEELDETGGDGGGIPARQVVARTRYRHRVDFWNPQLQ